MVLRTGRNGGQSLFGDYAVKTPRLLGGRVYF
jgi:hypothetical protein